ncbi:SWIM zinc finger family protein [Streptomyces sp. NPDC017943]|uniref:SWIM zinc finger family protein n=1 Tax=Streptomyces sp. NPDC017943 TaxID=3365019 RepID=UPI003788BF3E
MSARPADEARRALREARERTARDRAATQDPAPTAPARQDPSGPGDTDPATGGEHPGPANVAREALRAQGSAPEGRTPAGEVERDAPERDTSERGDESARPGRRAGDVAREALRAQGSAPEGRTPAGEGERDTSERDSSERGDESARPGRRAGDVAREALRAARDDARRARQETEREGARRRRRARQSAVDDRVAAVRRARTDAGGPGTRDVRELLSDAFRMPDVSDVADLPGGPEVPDGPEPDLPRSDRPGRPGRTHRSDPSDDPGPPDVPDADADADTALAEGNASAPRETHSAPYPDDQVVPVPPTAPAYARPRAPEDPATGGGPVPPSPGHAAPTAPEPPHASDTPHTPHTRPSTPAAPAARPSDPSGSGSRRSMAAPHRDSDLRRTFPPFPPREGETFAASWWGNAWVTALEQGALDTKRLERGRGYAEQGNVDAITVTPGLVLAYVQGSRPRPYRVQVRLRTLGDAGWDRFLDAAADRPGHIAALLDKEMPRSLADCGVPLLPGPGDLEPHCSCPDRGHPCKHAAALCYQTARLLDADPFVLLLLRGRGERELLDALSRLSATRAARAAQDKGPAPAPGVRATEVLAAGARPPLPAPLPAPPHPEQPPAYPASPGGPDPFALDQLATDAAARAHALLTTGRDPVGGLTFWQDAVRLAAARPGSGLTAGSRALYSSLASAAGRSAADLARAVAAWRQGGPEGLAVLEEPWDPPAGRFDRARPLLLAADLPAFRPWRNHLTHPRGHLQLRLGRDGLWYAYESEPGREDWWPRGTPDLDPVGALTGLGAPGDV